MMIRNIRLKFFFCLSTLIWIPIGNMAQAKRDSVQHLQEVTVTGVRPLIKADLDKFTYNVSYDSDSKKWRGDNLLPNPSIKRMNVVKNIA